MKKITEAHLDALVLILNKETKSPIAPYVRMGDKLTAQIGNYHLDYTYGGVSLCRMMNESGGITTVFSCTSKRDCAEKLNAFINGLRSL